MDENKIAISFGRWLATLCIFDGNNNRWLYCGNIKYYSTEEIFDIFMKETGTNNEVNTDISSETKKLVKLYFNYNTGDFVYFLDENKVHFCEIETIRVIIERYKEEQIISFLYRIRSKSKGQDKYDKYWNSVDEKRIFRTKQELLDSL